MMNNDIITCTSVIDRQYKLLQPLVFIFWLAFVAWGIGFSIFFGSIFMMPMFFILTYITLIFAIFVVYRLDRDWFSPLFIVLFIGFVRFSIPGFLILSDVIPDIPIFSIIKLEKSDWYLSYVLSLMGLLGVVIGWFLPTRLPQLVIRQVFTFLRSPLSVGVPYAAVLGMLLGFIALLLFVGSNASILEVIRTGEFRGTEIQSGTGIYFYLSLMLIAGSVCLSAYLSKTKHPPGILLLPVFMAMILFFILGGRARALTPFFAGLLLLWYQESTSKSSIWIVLKSTLMIMPPLLIFLLAGQLYRGGLGGAALLEALSISQLFEYIRWAIWTDLGQLHSLARAITIGEGVLGGRTFFALLWPLSEILNLPGRSAGIFIVETLIGFEGKKWGFHSTLIGDAYLNFGLIGVLIVTTLFGMIMKTLYKGFKKGLINSVFYVIATVYSVRVFFESIDKYGETLVVMSFGLFVIVLGRILSPRNVSKKGNESPPRYQHPFCRRGGVTSADALPPSQKAGC